MRGHIDLGVVELTAEDLAMTPEELETQREIDSRLEMSEDEIIPLDMTSWEERQQSALKILERETVMQEERELMWKKEKMGKRIKRGIKTSFWVIVVGILLFAWLSGYRIPVSTEMQNRVLEIYNAAKDYFVEEVIYE